MIQQTHFLMDIMHQFGKCFSKCNQFDWNALDFFFFLKKMPLLNWDNTVFKFSWVVSLFWLKEGTRRCESAQPLGDEPKMQLSMRGETGDRHDALRAGWLWEDFDSHPGREVIFPPFFSSCRMIKSQMSDTARHPKSAHCINISHRWQLCIKTTCS